MAKKIIKQVKLQIQAGKANPAPPVGPALGQAGINIGDFVNKFNEATKDKMGSVVPVVISVYDDRSYDFIMKTSPASDLILKKVGKPKGSGKNLVSKIGSITKEQVREIATEKMSDLNANDLEAASKIIEGTARSMGVDVK
ncbi:MAG: 50S ribosomal protein L11 [Parcubacteria group bacterium GW2011_GWD2_42_14]|nr:MAG: 50S ribosomal protein L11 [Parcubacteria group bacterium GW2011_GWD2_42_14]